MTDVNGAEISEKDQEHIFMTAVGIDGEVTTEGYEDTIAVREFNYEIKLPLTKDRSRGGVTRDKSIHSQVTIKKVADLSSVKFFQNCCEGTAVANIKFQFIRFAQGAITVSREIEINDVMISKFTHLGTFSGDADLPVEEISMDFANITDTYTQQNSDGSSGGNVTFGWDKLNGKAL